MPILAVAERLGIKVGKNNSIRCPFPDHVDANPSFSFFPSTNSCFCHACGKGGDVINFASHCLGVSQRDALSWLRQQFGLGGRRDRRSVSFILPSTTSTVSVGARSAGRPATQSDWQIYDALCGASPLQADGAAYLHGRAFRAGTIAHFRVGQVVDPGETLQRLRRVYPAHALHAAGVLRTDGRLLFPADSLIFPFTKAGIVQYLQSRAISADGARWMGPVGITKPVFNLDALHRNGEIYVCEGVTDVLAAHDLGRAAIGLLGSMAMIPSDALVALKGRSVCLMPDMDRAGDEMERRLGKQLDRARISWVRKTLPFGSDLSEYLSMKRAVS